jgi:acetolactate synthase-1/2/3 large subunit
MRNVMEDNNGATVAQRLIERAAGLGIKYIFANLGSDHPAFIEAFAKLSREDRSMPRVIICPHEMTALSAAHGYSMITREPQLVLVHVDVGTQNLGGSIHNAARGRIPAIIVAGLCPVTDSGGRTGSRNEFIHYIQDAPRQHEIVSQYVKWSYEVRAAEAVEKILLRGIQIATTPPDGPVYITGAREVWDTPVDVLAEDEANWPRARTAGLSADAAAEIHRCLGEARRPIIITSYIGREPLAVELLVKLSEKLGVGVCEVSSQYMNFPGDHSNHLEYRRNAFVDEADLILMIDVDVPWIPALVRPAAGTRIFHIDIDPLKQSLGYWHFPASGTHQANSLEALAQLLAIKDPFGVSDAGRPGRLAWIGEVKNRAGRDNRLEPDPGGAITAEELTAEVRELVTDRTIVIAEAPSSTEIIPTGLRMKRPGSYFTSGGSGLGWGINAAIGLKLAEPGAEVIALVGDGSYQFGVPSSAYWAASTYRTPFLTIIYNNGGWYSPKLSANWVHPEGQATQSDAFWVNMTAGARLSEIAAACGDTAAFRVTDRGVLRETLKTALQEVRSGRGAVVDVAITPISGQVLG